jgi:hypothetical protein
MLLIGQGFSMQETKLRYIQFERDQLPEMFQGLKPYEKEVSIGSLLNTDFEQKLTAVWKDERQRFNPLPNLILGGLDRLSDLTAWARAYMSGVGPLSGLFRLTTPEEFRSMVGREPEQISIDPSELATQVAIILAEVVARAPQTVVEKITLRACQSTLSFAIFRAHYLGLMVEPTKLADRWSQVRRQGSSAQRDRVSVSVLAACQSSQELPLGLSDELYNQRPTVRDNQRGRSSFNNEELFSIERMLVDPNLARRPKEDLVLALDSVVAKLVGKRGESRDYHRLVAELISKTTEGFANQLELARPAAVNAPESILMLALLQRSRPPAEIFSAFDGVGWKLLSRLTDSMDPLKRPDCDVSFEEAFLFDRHRSGALLDLNRGGRIRVEIAWGISTEVNVDDVDARSNFAKIEAQKELEFIRQHELERAEAKVFEALEILRRMREPSTRRRR